MGWLGSVLWWLVLGALLGVLASWWIGRAVRGPLPVPAPTVVERPVEKIVEKLVEKEVERVVEKPVDRPVDRVVDNPAHLARIAALEGQLAELQARRDSAPAALPVAAAVPAPAAAPFPTVDLAIARAHGFELKGPDDLEVIEGIGPKIAEMLRAEGIATFAALAARTPAELKALLAWGGPTFKLANPTTWPDQADLAARNRWSTLRLLQDSLTAGRRP